MAETARRARRGWVVSAIALLATACGGGDGGGTAGQAPDTLPPLSTDDVPAGARIDVSARDFLPFHAGDTWVYTRTSGGLQAGLVTRTVTSGPDAAGLLAVSETQGADVDVSHYRIDGSGLTQLDPLDAQGFLPGLFAALPSFEAYPTPFYPAGATLRHVRQGSLQTDLDGDAKNDSFRVETTQTFIGFETLGVNGEATEVAHFRTTATLTTLTTSRGNSATFVASEDSYLASGLGLVRADRSVVDGDGQPLEAPYRLDLQRATVNGVDRFAGAAIAIAHASLVYDASRGVYYASVASSDAAFANRIATIDALTGAVSYSAPVGSSPGPLAVSSDGSVLYVGLDGSGEVLRLSPPTMTEVARVRLPVDPFFGQLFAEDISISPAANDVLAMSMNRGNSASGHSGVALVRAMIVQPQRTQANIGGNRIAFDATGAFVFGFNSQSTEFGLRRLQVLADGLAEIQVTPTGGGFGTDLTVTDGLAVIGNGVFRADPTLALLGTVAGGRDCIKLPGVAKIACHAADTAQIVVVDSVNFATLATLSYGGPGFGGPASSPWRVVAGPQGRVAVSEPGAITLIANTALQ